VATLDDIGGPGDLRGLSAGELRELASDIRSFLVASVTRTGGHLGPNLGVVELTLALHRVFDSPRDRILWDTGHQAYVHKLLTGRRDFGRLRAAGGLSGYPSRAESDHDVIENSHASTALGYADGLAKAYALRGLTGRRVVAVVGDGALTGGMAWEALNNIAAAKDRPVTIVVNDNERSYAPTVGGLADHLAALRTTSGYERVLAGGKDVLGRVPAVGRPLYGMLHGAKKGLKDFLVPQGLFEDLGIKYIGPVDGHDLTALETALRRARGFAGPVLVHCITQKGRGYTPAVEDTADRFHAINVVDPETGRPVAAAKPSWTSVFADEMTAIGAERPDVVGITAAMLIPVGLHKFAAAHPDRTFDVGIAEQHAAVSAAGLATGGLHPVVAVYATFLNRAFDQVLMDVALHRLGVTFVLDRAGVTGPDGASHNGVWDLPLLLPVPGLRVAAPRDAVRLRDELREAVGVSDGPTVVRFPKGAAPEPLPALARIGGMDVLAAHGPGGATALAGPSEHLADVLLVAVGAMAPVALDAAARLAELGVTATVVDPRWVIPVDPELPGLAARHGMLATVEDGSRTGGVGSAVAQALRDADIDIPTREFGVPRRFLDHAERPEILAGLGLTGPEIAARLAERVFARQALAGARPSRRVEETPKS
jgi:1-deoxy-D-xylulose-5-phosphate synthase